MPYILTTRTPVYIPGEEAEAEYVDTEVSRRAVATLEEARQIVRTLINERWSDAGSPRIAEWSDYPTEGYHPKMGSMGPQGCTVGPLPDGTVIEVKRVSNVDLWERMGAPKGVRPTHDLIDAYNARQACDDAGRER